MSRRSAFLVAGLVLAATPAIAAPITFNTALPVTWGEWILRLQAKGFDFASDPTGLNRDLSVQALPLVGVYGLTPRFTLFAIAPLLDKELEVDTPLGRRSRGDSGLGDEARLDFSYQHRVWPRELGAGVPAFLYTVLESNLVWRDRDAMDGVDVVDSGGTTWFLAPGLQYVHKRWVLETAVQIPVTQNLHGAALETDWISTLSLRVNV